MKYLLLPLFSVLVFTSISFAQNSKTISDSDWCLERNRTSYNGSKEKHCEVREIRLDSRRSLSVDGKKNGGISIKSWDRDEILITAKISVYTRNEDEAIEIVNDVTIKTNSVIEADVPKLGRREAVSVDYRIYVPKQIDLDLVAFNGGISIRNVEGDIDFETLNGGLRLSSLSGKVTGETTNGGIKVELSGSEWVGEKLDVETTNGGIVFYIPEDYNAQLETGTVNGSMDFDFPVTISGRFNKELSVSLGDGGNLVRVMTTNGGIKIKRASEKLSMN
ncbi:MAG: hypothetical protein JJ932_15605 [Balneolaceae bacterium]|nr:hypothetical protein [Balneolaceae bacterium]MBO6649220.1 hypothetical protein [Balneolaceae bacterium]